MIPRLIHPIEVVLSQVNRIGTTYDEIFREPVGAVATTTITLQGQLRELRGQSLKQTGAGADPVSNALGRVVFEVAALDAAGVTLHLGDRITSLGGRSVNYRVLRLEDHAHYQGRAWHRWAFYGPES